MFSIKRGQAVEELLATNTELLKWEKCKSDQKLQMKAWLQDTQTLQTKLYEAHETIKRQNRTDNRPPAHCGRSVDPRYGECA